jgi:hypothetical protein
MAKLSPCLLTWTGPLAMIVLSALPADAQFRPRPLNEPATAEQFHIEASAAIWKPSADITISSESLGIPGSLIDFKRDLGLTDEIAPEFKFTLQPVRTQKLRVQVIPIKYEKSARLTRDVVFNGQRYTAGLPVSSTLDWKAWRFTYEFDFIARNQWFVGFIIEMRYNDIRTELTAAAPSIQEFTQARFPLPALGGIARVYVVPNVSITGEMTGLKIGRIGDVHNANWADVDIYGTANFTRNVGAQIGFRSVDLGYEIEADSGSLTLRGIYFGIVARY